MNMKIPSKDLKAQQAHCIYICIKSTQGNLSTYSNRNPFNSCGHVSKNVSSINLSRVRVLKGKGNLKVVFQVMWVLGRVCTDGQMVKRIATNDLGLGGGFRRVLPFLQPLTIA